MKLSEQTQDYSRQLWIRFQQGDELAFAELYETHIQTIYNYAKKFTNDEALIEDTIHNLFIYLWQSKDKLAVPLSIKFYLFTAIKRRIIKELELVKKRDALVQDVALENKNLSQEYVEESFLIENIDEEELRGQLEAAFSLLTNNQRQAIELKYYKNLSCQEISGIMGINPDNVYKLISRGLVVLKKNVPQNICLILLIIFLLA